MLSGRSQSAKKHPLKSLTVGQITAIRCDTSNSSIEPLSICKKVNHVWKSASAVCL